MPWALREMQTSWLMRDFMEVGTRYGHDDQILLRTPLLGGRLAKKRLLVGADCNHSFVVHDHQFSDVLLNFRSSLRPAEVVVNMLLRLSCSAFSHGMLG
jgi:hypothetical protein